MTEVSRAAASFRDPAGFVFQRDGTLYRQVNQVGQADYDRFISSGLYETLSRNGQLVSHEEVSEEAASPSLAYRVIRPERVPFISYPYEWSFGQLQAAALLTLDLQSSALEHGMSLKDASAYNVQFVGSSPVFIDTLSFETYEAGSPWVAYQQFCRHFLAPLALMSRVDIRLNQLLRANIDGIPLDLASRLLPALSKLNPGLLIHLHLHATMQGTHSDRQAAPPKGGFKQTSMLGLIDNLRSTVKSLAWKQPKTEWRDYTSDNSYTDRARTHKHELIDRFLKEANPSAVWDVGGNTGEYSRIASGQGRPTVSFDIDPACVERNFQQASTENDRRILPLLLDLTNPSPGIGWSCAERSSLIERGPAELVMALALVHHLAIVHNVPLPDIAEFFAKIGRQLIIEFVPKDDVQVQRLLKGRRDIFDHYSQADFEAAFQGRFEICERVTIEENGRVLYRMVRS